MPPYVAPPRPHISSQNIISTIPMTTPFEGPEKLLEIWFAPSATAVPDACESSKCGLKKVDRSIWEEMLSIVKCKVLSVIEGVEVDSYLLSESSLFISPHRLILKTCGTTLNLYGLPRILEIARDHASLPTVYQCFYSRKSFMFPERQLGPHRDWVAEIQYLDSIFKTGSAYTVGRVNGDHWLLYIINPPDQPTPSPPISSVPDSTIEILMTHLNPSVSQDFFNSESSSSDSSTHAASVSSKIGITNLFPSHLTTLDAYSFIPCGYSSNALLKFPLPGRGTGEGYYTIHVTPQQDFSYASFECNVLLPTAPTVDQSEIPDLGTLIQRVVSIFQPGKLSLTLFISSEHNNSVEDEGGESAIEAAQRVFRLALTSPSESSAAVYKRTDKINYEFGSYDLAFASFELNS